MAAAVKAAEASSGGKAVGAEFSEKDGAGLWEVEMVNGTKRSEVKIDASTGAVVKTKDKGDIADKDHPVTLDMLGAPLTDLVTKAETEGAGKVMSIDFEHEDGEPVGLAVEIVKANGVIQDFILNPADGKLTPATGQSDEGQDEEDGDSGEGNG
ncbi:MAG: PepSY domain-containing protein [Hyphomicrobiales bacterium]|nr:PepSY domain-containing protein [Hyphomicrobiales bacterium]